MPPPIFIPTVDMIFRNTQSMIDVFTNNQEMATLIEVSLSHDDGLSSKFNSTDGTRCIIFKYIPSWFDYFQCNRENDVMIGIRCESFVTVLKMLKNSYIRIMYSKERPDVLRLQGLDNSSGEKLIRTLKKRQDGNRSTTHTNSGSCYSSIRDIYGDGLSEQSALEMHLMNIDSESSSIPEGLPYSSCVRVPSKWLKDVCDPVLKDKTFSDDICIKIEQTEFQQSLAKENATINFMVISKGDLGTYIKKKTLPVVSHDDEILYFPQGSDSDFVRLANKCAIGISQQKDHQNVTVDLDDENDSGNEYNPDSPYSYEMIKKIAAGGGGKSGKGKQPIQNNDDDDDDEEDMTPVVNILAKRPGRAPPKGSSPTKKQKLSSTDTQDWPDSDEEQEQEQEQEEEEEMEDITIDYKPTREEWEVDDGHSEAMDINGHHHHRQQSQSLLKRAPEHYVIMDRDFVTPWKITNVIACKYLSVCLGLARISPYVSVFLSGPDAEINGQRGIPMCIMYFLDRNESASRRSVYIQFIATRNVEEDDYENIDL